ncbi:MAG: cysteine desulfurase family protein [Oscillospiraceae bacterium]
MIQELYLDNAATTKVDASIASAVVQMLTENYGNSSSLHKKGVDSWLAIANAKKKIAAYLNTQPETISFVSSGSMANSIAILGVAFASKRWGNKIITSTYEHDSVLSICRYLATQGFEIIYVNPQKDGKVSPKEISDLVDDHTILVSILSSNNEVGSRNDIEQICHLIKEINPKTMVHTDAVQSFGKVNLNVKGTRVDLLTASGHKIHAPKGIGVLYTKKNTKLHSIFTGNSQPRDFFPGTENAPHIHAMGLATENAQLYLNYNYKHVTHLNSYLREQLNGIDSVYINSDIEALPYILNFSVLGIRSEILLHYMEQYSVYISSGSACAKGKKSHVLKALGLSDQRIDSAIRVSFSKENTVEQLDFFIATLKNAIVTIIK